MFTMRYARDEDNVLRAETIAAAGIALTGCISESFDICIEPNIFCGAELLGLWLAQIVFEYFPNKTLNLVLATYFPLAPKSLYDGSLKVPTFNLSHSI
jgi:hypothetical protein